MDSSENKKYNSFKNHILLNGFNFSVGILALSALNSGLKVSIKLPSNFDKSFQPELSCLYPTGFIHAAKQISSLNFLLKCSTLFPHHFYPQRLLSFRYGDKINRQLNTTFDKLLGRDRESSTLPLITSKYKEYQKLSNHFPNGNLVYEFRFDRNRAIVDLLKLCLENGLLIVNDKTQVNSNLSINCIPFNWKDFALEIEHFKWSFPNNIHIEKSGFNLTFQGVFDKTIVQIHLKDVAIKYKNFKNEVLKIFENLGIPIPDYFDEKLYKIFTNKVNGKDIDFDVINDPNLNNLRSTTLKLISNVSDKLGIKIKRDSAFRKNKKDEMKNDNFRLIQNECDEKFDLAKQTGIDYKDFILLFYRYRNQIDELIDAAYEMMNEERNPTIIWEKVEENYLRNELPGLV